MTKKIIFAGACTLLILGAVYVCSELALTERGYTAVGGEICIPIIGFCLWAGVKTVKDIRRAMKHEKP